MSDEFDEVTYENQARVERVPNVDARVGAQYFAEDAARDLEPSMGAQAELLTKHDGTETEEEVDAGTGDTSGE